MDIQVSFTDAEWARIVPALETTQSLVDVEAEMAQFLRTCIKNVVHGYERNKEFDTMNTKERARQEKDSWA